ncbi:metal dependent phosphohydrolase [Desulfuromusa kysingii]|uniref:Metal dependent phosphohydrolase n=1 Tax=Desulfuromusa kysingii TaxID=37625 RepID=A0A1H4BFT4_9BACT|nr:HD domain-containing protein [Desulfuromusa kysingii]SEA46957.1 metal dependent phosphohydrolase [Desulfuromusa kysingii]
MNQNKTDKIYINQIKERDRVESIFLVRDKITAMAKNGKPYMTLKLMDRTGEVEGRIWDQVDHFSAIFAKNDFIQVNAKASVYMGKMQLVVQDLKKVDEDLVELADFLPVSKRSAQEMRAELEAVLASLTNPHIEALLRAFFDDPEFYALYSKAPAAKAMHHVFLGGLLEHSLAVVALATDVASRYPQVNRDLLICGALLHDVGKVNELTYIRSFDYTDEGKLLGHIVIGVQMVEDRIRGLEDFPHELSMLIKHLLLSHHGQYDYGSPKRPKFLEAVILNFIDDLDSKINGVLTHIDKEPDREENWTNYHRLYDRYFYKGSKPKDKVQSPVTTMSESKQSEVAPKGQNPQNLKRQRYDKPLGSTLGDQLREKNLNLFSTLSGKGEKP